MRYLLLAAFLTFGLSACCVFKSIDKTEPVVEPIPAPAPAPAPAPTYEHKKKKG